MKLILTISLIAYSAIVYSQNYTFSPSWKKGEKKTLSIEYNEKEFSNNKLILDTTYFNKASIEVLNEKSEDYTIQIIYPNQGMRKAMELYEDLGKEFDAYKDLKLKYAINKKSGAADLINWKEVQSFITLGFDKIKNAVDGKGSSMNSMDLIFKPIMEIFSTKENIEAYMYDHIYYMLIPYNDSFTVGDTLVKTEIEENPFNPNMECSSTTRLLLDSYDQSKNECHFIEQTEIDLDEFVETMKMMMRQMTKSMGVDDSTAMKKINEIDNFMMDMEMINSINYNTESTWVTKIVEKRNVSATRKNGKFTRKEVTKTTIIK